MVAKSQMHGGLLNYDEILKHLGQFGKFQIRVHFLLWLVSAAAGLAVVVWAFTGFNVKYRCPIPKCDTSNNGLSYYDSSLSELTLPNYAKKGIPNGTLEEQHRCNYYKVSLDNKEPVSCEEYMSFLKDSRAIKIETPCQQTELIFDTSIVTSSITQKYNLTCGNFGLRSIIGSIYMLGMLIGSMFFGLISDKYGRMTALMISVIFLVVSALLCAIVPMLGLYGFFRFITGMGGMGCFMVAFVLAVEYVGFHSFLV